MAYNGEDPHMSTHSPTYTHATPHLTPYINQGTTFLVPRNISASTCTHKTYQAILRNTHDIQFHVSQLTFYPSYMGAYTSAGPQVKALERISSQGTNSWSHVLIHTPTSPSARTPRWLLVP